MGLTGGDEAQRMVCGDIGVWRMGDGGAIILLSPLELACTGRTGDGGGRDGDGGGRCVVRGLIGDLEVHRT